MSNTAAAAAPAGEDHDSSEIINPSTKVFTTIELLTKVLESCYPQDLLCNLSRVNSTFKNIIDTNRSIQQRLFFIPCDTDGTPTPASEFKINPFWKKLAYKRSVRRQSGCDYDLGPRPATQEMIDEGLVLTDDADTRPDDRVKTYMEFNWKRIAQDERFTREEASWKRMLPAQPSSREIWNHFGGRVDAGFGREVRPKMKLLGKTWESVKIRRDNPCCTRLRTFLRSSQRFGIVVMTNVEIWSNETGEQQDIYEANNGYMLNHWPAHEE